MLVFGRVRAWHERGFLDSAERLAVDAPRRPGRLGARLRRPRRRPAGLRRRRLSVRRLRRPRRRRACAASSSRARWSAARGRRARAKSIPFRRLADRRPQRLPQRQLAGDPDHQPLELDHPAQRRVADQAVVGLQPPELLAGPRRRVLDRARLHPEPVHHLARATSRSASISSAIGASPGRSRCPRWRRRRGARARARRSRPRGGPGGRCAACRTRQRWAYPRTAPRKRPSGGPGPASASVRGVDTRIERIVLETDRHRIVGDLTLPRDGLSKPPLRLPEPGRDRVHPAHRRRDQR